MQLQNRENLTDAVWRCIAWDWGPMPANLFDGASKGLYAPIQDLIGGLDAKADTVE